MDQLWTSVKQVLGFSPLPIHTSGYTPPAGEVSSPLLNAVINGEINVVQQLLADGGDPNAEDWRGFNALHMTSMGSNAEMLRLLLDNGGDIHAISEGGGKVGMMALGFAVCGDEKELFRILMARGVTTGPHELSEYGTETYRRIVREIIRWVSNSCYSRIRC